MIESIKAYAPIIIFVALILLVFLSVFFMGIILPKAQLAQALFLEGQIVETVIGKNQAMVIHVNCDFESCTYKVRLPSGDTTFYQDYELNGGE